MDPQTVVHWLGNLARYEAERAQALHAARRAGRRRRLLAELLAEAEADVAAEQDGGEGARRLRLMEAELADLRSRRERLETQRQQVKDNKTYRALSQEISGLAGRIDAAETELLREMERVEGRRGERASQEDELADQRRRIGEERAGLQRVEERAAAEAAALEREIAICLEQVPRDVRARLERLREGLPQPVAFLDGAACGGCHAQFPAQKALEIEKGRTVVRCQACGRYVVPRP